MLGVGRLRHARAQAKEFKIGFFIALSGPAALFGPTQRACADLAAEKINKAGGIMGRPVKLLFTDAGGPPAETAKSAVRLMLEDKVDLFIGSHDSATREANVATIKGKVPYIYSPVYEGGECSPNVYCLGETPPQQAQPAIEFFAKEKKAKTFYLIGDDYVWPRKSNEQVKKFVAQYGGKVIGEEYVPFGAPNKFEEAVTRIKGAKPDAVVSTLVGADNVNFNRTFAGFGLDKTIARMALLLEENTLLGIGAENSGNLYSCMGYFANNTADAPKKFKAEYMAQVRRQGAAAQHHRRRLLLPRSTCAKALFEKAGTADMRKLDDGVGRPGVRRAIGARHDARPPGRQGHVPGELQGHRLRGHQDHQGRAQRHRLQGLRPRRAAHHAPLHDERWSRCSSRRR